MTATRESIWTLPMVLEAARPLAEVCNFDVRAHVCRNSRRELVVHLEFSRGDSIWFWLKMGTAGPDGLDSLLTADDVRAEVERCVAVAITKQPSGPTA